MLNAYECKIKKQEENNDIEVVNEIVVEDVKEEKVFTRD